MLRGISWAKDCRMRALVTIGKIVKRIAFFCQERTKRRDPWFDKNAAPWKSGPAAAMLVVTRSHVAAAASVLDGERS
ncbi:MAG: hypothetical protein B7Z73_00890 [Planctomycetia bacterium 21-64-5]|nr:MAG: hypothetical protein B7Z73_00890 [Planctomycetia bacterium 21-64-5]